MGRVGNNWRFRVGPPIRKIFEEFIEIGHGKIKN